MESFRGIRFNSTWRLLAIRVKSPNYQIRLRVSDFKPKSISVNDFRSGLCDLMRRIGNGDFEIHRISKHHALRMGSHRHFQIRSQR